ncbi:hypothetical protein [Spongiactinospora sp. TRM90649]|uniref:hypothetical protein n=1 Tax=Spongiactinospora sp. TRM90649 TaxID=3031114 RepID=UPI0023F75DB7|nr:hypothetical protein [Spongiactinospora sp. TRM90649]MDF5755792.1 hypothetical protein [Spongiactinospora sp. TRM90649]
MTLTTAHIEHLRAQLKASEDRLGEAQRDVNGWRHLLTYATANGPQPDPGAIPDPLSNGNRVHLTALCACRNASDPTREHGTLMCSLLSDAPATSVPAGPRHRAPKAGKS